MILTTLLNIAIFQGMVLGLIILKAPLFRSKANKYFAYAIFTLSLLLLNLVLETVELYSVMPLLHIIDNIEWAFAFPVFIFLFVIHQVSHPIRHSKKIWWRFVPFLYSAVINSIYDADDVAHLFEIPNSIKTIMETLKFL